MTREEFYTKYGDVKVKFDFYYKYVFHYIGILEGGLFLNCQYGGNNEAIYRHAVRAGCEETVRSLQPITGYIVNLKGEEVDSFYDY